MRGFQVGAFLGLAFTLFTSAEQAHAFGFRPPRQPVVVSLNYSSYDGSGCPEGTAAVSQSPDKKVMSVLYDGFSASADNSTPTDEKTCNIWFSLTAPRGYNLVITKSDKRGFVDLTQSSTARLSTSLWLYDQYGWNSPSTVTRAFTGPLSDDFLASAANTVRSRQCGGHHWMYLSTKITAQAASSAESTSFISVDSEDIEAKVGEELFLGLFPCG